ncbi:hypothetical protein GCM10010430_30010 [Kitasatospora cystarginea]|uniref:PknH-like extracellular domain-containing protein n=1 Tax=Kitasatospora cystarginea TaxID=58350 RepID=A0ABN3E0Z7_9ACTN
MRKLLVSRAAKLVTAGALAIGLAGALAPAAQAATADATASPWLSGSEVPLAAGHHWKAQPEKRYTTTGEFQWLLTCGVGGPAKELGTKSISVMPFTDSANSHDPVDAAQILFNFKDSAAAKKAMATIKRDYAGCVKRRNAQHWGDETTGQPVHFAVGRTAVTEDGTAYRFAARNSSGKPAVIDDLPSEAQELFVQNGPTISMISINASRVNISDTTEAAKTLAAMSEHLINS